MYKNFEVDRVPNPLYNNKITRTNILYDDGPIYEEINNTLKIYAIDRNSAETILENFMEECNFDLDTNIKQVYLVRQKDHDGNVYVISILYKIDHQYKYRHIKVERSIRMDGSRGNHFVINCSIRLYDCDSIEKVIDFLKNDVCLSDKINFRYLKNKELLFGFNYNF